MLFLEWWLIGRISIEIFILVMPFLAIRIVRKWRLWIRIPVWVLSGLLEMCAIVVLLFLLILPSPNVYSVPVYSPNKERAARIHDYNASGFGGAYNSVELFTFHGLHSDIVYDGEWSSVRVENIRWRGDSELDISYDGPEPNCKSTAYVLVRCIHR